MRKILGRLKQTISRKVEQILNCSAPLGTTVDFLELARAELGKREFSSALTHYLQEKNQNAQNLEAYIGTAVCYIQLGKYNDALSILSKANAAFGDHDAILALITKCKLHEESWSEVEHYWQKWRASFLQYPLFDFYQTTGEILVNSLKTDCWREEFTEKLIAELVFQDDRSVDSKSHPVVCSLLFHHHEYDRPFYLRLLKIINSFLTKHPTEKDLSNLCFATMLLTFGFPNKEERASLIKTCFYHFDLYSHWSFVLLGSSWNAIWDESIKSNVENIPIVKEILKNESERSNIYGVTKTYKLIFLANVCYPGLTPVLIEHARQLLDQGEVHEEFRDDLAFIVQQSIESAKKDQSDTKHRLKIAFCISGQLRGWEQAFRSWQKLGLSEHDVTFIVHTWKDTGGGVPIPPKDERALPPSFQKEFRKVWNKIGQKEMFSRYPSFFSLWSQNGTDVEESNLMRVYGSEYVFIDDDSVEPFQNLSNSEKMYYKIWECQNAADQIGIDFDLVVRIRPDLEFTENHQIDWRGIYQDCIHRNVLFCESYSTYFFPNIGFCMPDQFAIGSPSAMRGYSSAYAMTRRCDTWKDLNLKGFPQEFVAHKNVAYSTLYNGAVVEHIGLPCRFSPAFTPNKEMIYKAIRRDAAERNDSFDDALINAL